MRSFDDPFEQRMKSTIAEWFRYEQSRKLEQARSSLSASRPRSPASSELFMRPSAR